MKPDPYDPKPMLVIFIGAVSIAAWRAVASIDPGQLLHSIAFNLAPFALGAIAIASALAAQRFLSTRRALSERIASAVVPADEFEAGPETVLRFAAELARSDRSLRGWLNRRASALRVGLASDKQGRLVYFLTYPARSRELVRAALRGYEGVELREISEVLPEWPRADRVKLRTELVPARPSIEPLARLGLDPDPLQPFAAAMASLRSAEGERVWVCVDLLPASGRRASRLARRLKRQAKRRHGERRSLLEILDGERRTRGRGDPAELFERRMVGEALNAKLRDAGPLFEAQILLRADAADRSRAKAAMGLLLAAFEPLSAHNWLRPSGLGIGDTVFLGSDFPTCRRGFDRRFRTALHRPSRRAVLTARELAGFLKPPTAHCVSKNIVRSGTLLPAPPALPAFEQGKGELIPLGKVSGEGGRRILAARSGETFFTYVAGRSRYGKTETAIAQFVHLMRSGHGGLFLDPHGDALERIRPYLSEPQVARRVVEIDVGPGSALPGWNLFELGGEDGATAEARVAAIVDAFASTLKWGDQSTRAINLTTQAASALAYVARALPPELAPTIFQIPTLLSDESWREAALPFLPAPAQGFWTERFPLLAEEAITPVTNLVDRLRASTPIAALLGQSEGTYRVREAMDEGWIVLAHPGAGDLHERLLANLLLFDLLRSAKARGELAAGRRRPFWVFLDEVQSYDSAASGTLAALLEQSAKFGLRAVVLNQNPERLNPQTLTALTTNRSHMLATTMNSRAAALLTREWGGRPDPAALTKMARFRFIAQVTHRGELSEPFALEGIRVEDVAELPEAGGEEPAGGAVARMDAAQATRHLEGLDGRILAALRERRSSEAREAPAKVSAEQEKDGETGGLWVPGARRPKP
ncbi:MAG TPA: hypothetical protein VFT19_10765 [Solirubrobacterales bacterium]|nr:hypothetical protein [Solirubrobacterales bacterium]